MKAFRFIAMSSVTTVFILLSSCDKVSEDLNALRRNFGVFCNELSEPWIWVEDFKLDGEEYPVSSYEQYPGDYNPEFSSDISYSFKVTEGSPVTTVQNFSGTLALSAFIKDQKNTVEVVRNGSAWKLLVNGSNADIGGGGNTNGYDCVSGNCNVVVGGGQYATLSACESACGGGGTTELLNTIVSGGAQDRQYVHFTLPAGVTFMEVRTKETPPDAAYNNADLFVNRGSNPTCNDDPFISYDADCGSLSNNREQDACTFNNPQAGEWYVMLYNYNGGFYASNLVVTITQ